MSFFNPSANSGGNGGLFGAGTAANQAGGSNNKPAVNIFGGAANSSLPASGPNIFGNTGTSSATTPGSLFGSTPNSTSTTATGGELFGNANASSAAKPAGSGLFGAATNTTPSVAPATSGLFGAATTGAKGGSIFGGSNTSTTLTPATGGSIFGSTPSASSTATTSTATNPLFGGSSPFSLPKPADSGAKPAAASNFFAQPPSGTGAAPSGAQGLFGLPAKPADTSTTSTPGGGTTSTTTTSTAASGGTGLFGGGGLFPKPPATTPSSTAVNTATSGQTKDTPASSTALGAGLFGTKPDEGKKGTAAAAPFSLFGGAKPDEKKDSPAGTTTGAVVAIAPPSMLRGKTLEEIINKWTTDLEGNVREFDKFAAEVAAWDRALIENGNNIAALYSHVLAAEKQQNEINEALNHIEQQQNDLATTLDAYEKVSQEILGGQSSTLRTLDTGPADNERDKNYMLATDLHTHLDDLSGSLTQMIESVNTLSITARSDESSKDPMAQITQILSSHLESLQWIDGAVREVETKASEVEKRIKESGHALPANGSKSRAFGPNR